MKTNPTIFKLMSNWMCVLVAATFSPLSNAQDPVTVTGVAIHYGGNIQYTYQVRNNTRARNIVAVSIGNRGLEGDIPTTITNEQAELDIYPAGSYWGEPNEFGDHQGESPRLGGIFSSPQGWDAGIQFYDETAKFSIDWGRTVQTDRGILPGQTFNFGVSVPLNDDPRSPYSMSDPAYLAGHFTARFSHSKITDEGPAFWHYTGPIISLDTAPPTLAVTLNPSILKANEKHAPISATISVSDNYDPAPEIRLESITSNEILEHGDIQDASFYLDDRSFKLRGEHKEGSNAGRIYTVTYSAIDASGNKAIATATVTVPHKRKEHEERREERNKKDKDEHKRDR